MWVLTGGQYTSLAKNLISELMRIADSPVLGRNVIYRYSR